MLLLISTYLSTECYDFIYQILLFIYLSSWTLFRVDGSAFPLLHWVITNAALLLFVNAGVMSLSMCIQEPVLLLLHFYWLPFCPLFFQFLLIFHDYLPVVFFFFFSLRWSGLLSASSVQFSKSATKIQGSTGLCCPTVSLIFGRICQPKFKWLILALFSIPWMWICPPIVLVLEVDGTLGEQNLLCMESPQELIVSANQSQEIFWKKNGIEQAQRGNSYRVQLEESLGGGNYTCHSEDGSLLNHTIVLIKEDESKRRKILVKTDEGMCEFDTNYTAEKTAYILKYLPCALWIFLLDYLKCTAQNYNGEFHCSWTWHSSRSGRVAFVSAHR